MERVRRRIGHLSEGQNGTFDTAIATIDFDEECYKELNKYINVIFSLQPVLVSYETVELSYQETLGLVEKYDHHFSTVTAPDAAQINILLGYLIEATQKITNFLSSVTSFLSCSEVRLKKEFGAESTLLNEWINFRKDLHSESFEYRFLYTMRNYSQHHYLPVSNVDIKLDNIVIGERSTSNSITIDRDELLDSGFNWPKSLRIDIEKLDAKIDLIPIIDKYMCSVRKIAYRYIAIYKIEIQDCSRYMTELKRRFAFPENSTPVIYTGETREGQPVPNQIDQIPFFQFNWVNKHYFQLMQYTEMASSGSR
ncbi:MAG: hypothetical protein ACKVJE_14105 [Pseudomonadales bacterium]